MFDEKSSTTTVDLRCNIIMARFVFALYKIDKLFYLSGVFPEHSAVSGFILPSPPPPSSSPRARYVLLLPHTRVELLHIFSFCLPTIVDFVFATKPLSTAGTLPCSGCLFLVGVEAISVRGVVVEKWGTVLCVSVCVWVFVLLSKYVQAGQHPVTTTTLQQYILFLSLLL